MPPSLADMICSGSVDPDFILAVQELQRKYQFVNSPNDYAHDHENGEIRHRPDQTQSGKEMKEHITKLRHRAIGRIRTYFLQAISQLRKPKTNVRMIQVNSLLKYTPLLDFMLDAKPEIYNEIRNVYVESMSTTLYALFRTYAAQLALLDNEIATRKDVIAVEDSALRDVWTRVNMSKRGDAFYLGNRWEVLDDAPRDIPILAHVALSEKKTYPYEVIYQSIMTHLMDSMTNEFVFVRKFFQENGPDAFQGILERTLSLILEQLENYLFNYYDCLGLLLMIKLTHSNKQSMRDRKIDSLDMFFDSLTNLLWPRLNTCMKKQIRSVRDGDSKKLGGIDLHAHYVSRRYAEFTCSILQIMHKGKKGGDKSMGTSATNSTNNSGTNGNRESDAVTRIEDGSNGRLLGKSLKQSPFHRGSAGDMLLDDLSVLQKQSVLLLQRLSESHATNKNKIIFLINNLDQIISIFQERRVSGKEFNTFLELRAQQRELFVEEELLQNFSKMIAFVQQTEQHMNRPQSSSDGGRALAEEQKVEVNIQVVESLVREFSSSWKQGIEQINRNVLSFFANFRNGMEVLKQILTQLLLYYTRFQDILRKIWRSKTPSFCKDLVNTSTILAEIKKYALAI